MFVSELLHLCGAFLCSFLGVGDLDFCLFFGELYFELGFLDLLVLEFFKLFLGLRREVVLLLYFVLELAFFGVEFVE